MTLRVYKIMTMQTGDINELCDSIYFAGCTVGCSFCFNKEIADSLGTEMTYKEIIDSLSGVEWVCLMGGEPFEQKDNIIHLIYLLHNANKKVCLFTSHLDAWSYVHGRMQIDHIHIDLKLTKRSANDPVTIPFLNIFTISYGVVALNLDEWFFLDGMKGLQHFPIYLKSNLLNPEQDGKREYEILKRNGFLNLHMNEKINVGRH